MDMLKVALLIPLMLLFHWLMRSTSVLKVADKASWVSLGFGLGGTGAFYRVCTGKRQFIYLFSILNVDPLKANDATMVLSGKT